MTEDQLLNQILSNKTQLQQGDVLLFKINAIPSEAKEDEGSYVLAHGEHTGHAHRLVDDGENAEAMSSIHGAPVKEGRRKNFQILRDPTSNVTYLRVIKDSDLVHNEHMTFKVPVGDYAIRIVREKGMFDDMINPVVD